MQNLAPRIAINYSPADAAAQTGRRVFSDWTDVSRWASSLYDPQVVITDEIAIKARELTANAKTEFERIHAIGAYVQNLQYISIDIGVGYGNGYKPRASDLVLRRGYGDCKDKANLMRAMLKTLKIDSYPIAIYSGDPTFVRSEWASPRQFNHAIIAVRVSDTTSAATVMDHPKLGRLLIFDATDAYTPVGDLPDYLQGSNALIIAGENGGLSKMPVTPTDFDLLERDIAVTLDEMGQIKGTIREKAVGQTSAQFRREYRSLSAGDFRKAIEGWLTRGATGAQLVNLQAKDKHADAGFDLDVEFSASRYGQLMQNRLLVFKPVIVGRRNSVSLTEPKRSNPI
ncbi:MAG TPA: transglutaminase-like domain-containing protein, partial [Nitrospira sp.]|nr:transglutaminase-like domain-containing protein [Nitrospira sp.]